MLYLVACAAQDASVPAAPPPVLLLARTEPAALELPPSNMPDGGSPPVDLAVTAKWELQRTEQGVVEYKTPVPVAAGPCPTDEGARLWRGDVRPSRTDHGARLAADTFAVRGTVAFLRLPAGSPVPPADGWTFQCPTATAAESALNLAASGEAAAAFALGERLVAGATRRGLYLPAPGVATWTVDVPVGAVFTTTVFRLPAALRLPTQGDGASFALEVELDGQTRTLGEWKWSPDGTPVRVDLAELGGRTVTLRARSIPGVDAVQDYLFAEEPTIYVPSAKPKRVVLVFVDTLRPDHLGAWGYTRPTSPNIDLFATQSVVFTQARSVSGWTLPSAKAALSGALPHEWADHPTLADRLAAAGYDTAATVTNQFIAPTFDVHRGFGYYAVASSRSATQQTDHALALLAARPDRDLALFVHYIDPHVPYSEPEPYRSLWAGTEPPGFPERLDRHSLAAYVGNDVANAPAEVKDWVTARYDQEIRYVDTELARLFAALGDDATIVLFSDHGEELWDHGGFEHGHTNYDELLRVPLLFRAPGLAPRRVDVPVSLADVTPTLLELLGIPAPPMWGASLAGAARGDAAALDALTARSQVFGWKLYGAERWGVVDGGRKWETEQGRQHVFDLVADPAERVDLAARSDLDAFAAAFTRASSLPIVRAWRLQVLRIPKSPDAPVEVTVRSPGGFSKAWAAWDYRGASSKFQLSYRLEGDAAVLEQPPGATLPPEVFLLPNTPGGGLEVTIAVGDASARHVVAPSDAVVAGTNVLDVTLGGERVLVRPVATAELPETEGAALTMETIRQLRALGYAD